MYPQTSVWRWGDLFWPFSAFYWRAISGKFMRVKSNFEGSALFVARLPHENWPSPCNRYMLRPAWWRFCPNSVFTFSLNPLSSPPCVVFRGHICGYLSLRVHATKYGTFHVWNKYVCCKSQSWNSWKKSPLCCIIWVGAGVGQQNQGARHTLAWLLAWSLRFRHRVQIWA
jgi:hypothetical protein